MSSELTYNKVVNIKKNSRKTIESKLLSFIANNYDNKYTKALKRFRTKELTTRESKIVDMLKTLNLNSSSQADEDSDYLEKENGISFKEFNNVVKYSNDVKRDIESMLFSTKVIIDNKDDFISFVEVLFKNNLEEIVYDYIDVINKYFVYDEGMREVLTVK